MKKSNLLVIDDDPLFRAQVRLFAKSDYHVMESSGADTVESGALLKADIIVLDLNMPNKDGIEFIKTLSNLSPVPRLLIASGYEQKIIDMAQKTAELYGISGTVVLHKPFSRHHFSEAMAKLIAFPRDSKKSVSPQTVSTIDSKSEISQGIKAGEFVAYYQPQVCVDTQQVVGIEALARWDHPKYGILSPAVFIDTVESSSISDEFTLFIIEQSLKDYLMFKDKASYNGKISVNVPPKVFATQDFSQSVLNLIDKYQFPANVLILEITERGIDQMGPEMLANLTRLSMKGIKFSVDDFGTGQSGLSRLKTGIFDELKLDRTFIKDLRHSRKSLLIVESILNLASLSGLKVVAEGVEDPQTADELQFLGCHIIQGFLYAKPMAKEDFISWLPLHQARVAKQENNHGAV